MKQKIDSNSMENGPRPVDCLVGLDLKGGWHVESIRHRHPKGTGGSFSVGYLVVNNDGHKAYLKALDYSAAFEHPDPPRALQDLTTAYNFERDLLEKCKDRRLRRIVLPLDSGTVKVPGILGLLANVSYIIFELATGDIRREVAEWQEFDVAWALRSLHHSAVGLQELHATHIAHQDLKPSNVLVFPIVGSKLSDIGRASYMGNPSQNDTVPIAGDIGYAAPEQFYGWHLSTDFPSRFLVDNYHLGSLVFFFFLDCSATQAIRLKLSKKHLKNFTNTDFINDLPYIQQAFSEALDELSTSVKVKTEELSEEIVMIAQQLCEPNPNFRGNPSVLAAKHIPQYDLQPYISRFDRLARTAELRLRMI
jgi:serine/threonine protein kinase